MIVVAYRNNLFGNRHFVEPGVKLLAGTVEYDLGLQLLQGIGSIFVVLLLLHQCQFTLTITVELGTALVFAEKRNEQTGIVLVKGIQHCVLHYTKQQYA